MNKFIEQQLKKCKVAKVPNFFDYTTEIYIPKNGSKVEVKEFDVGYKCQIHVDDSLVKQCNWYNTIHGNWNNGVGPKSNTLNCTVLKVAGKMLQLDCVEVETGNKWTGWLPKGNITKIKEL